MNKKNVSLVIIVSLCIVLSATLSFASLSDDLSNGLMSVNDFFVSNRYQTYAQFIDFIFFSLMFISVYMIGARYGLKEVKRPEKVLVIVLGILSSFLLVSAGFSVTLLAPYIQWLLYFLLFTVLWLLLKGIKSKLLRFLIALLLTFLIVALLSGIEFPEVNIQF